MKMKTVIVFCILLCLKILGYTFLGLSDNYLVDPALQVTPRASCIKCSPIVSLGNFGHVYFLA